MGKAKIGDSLEGQFVGSFEDGEMAY